MSSRRSLHFFCFLSDDLCENHDKGESIDIDKHLCENHWHWHWHWQTQTQTQTPLWESWWGREQWGSCSPSPLEETQRRPEQKFVWKHIHLNIHPSFIKSQKRHWTSTKILFTKMFSTFGPGLAILPWFRSISTTVAARTLSTLPTSTSRPTWEATFLLCFLLF